MRRDAIDRGFRVSAHQAEGDGMAADPNRRGPGRRICLKCGRGFSSAGSHHRICRTCKRVRSPDETEPAGSFDADASQARRERGLRRLMGLPLRAVGLGRFLVGADLAFRTCQWIAGEPGPDDGCKCGRPTLRGAPYCAYHQARACPRVAVPPGQHPRHRAA